MDMYFCENNYTGLKCRLHTIGVRMCDMLTEIFLSHLFGFVFGQNLKAPVGSVMYQWETLNEKDG